MNLNNPYICDIETVGLLPDLTKGQEEDFHILGCSYKSGNEWKVITTNKKEDVFKLFENPDNVIVGHNFWLYDVPALEKIFPDLKIKATIIDTLWLSWYIEPNRIRHGLELYGEEFGVPKPEVTEDQWKGIGMTKEEHTALMKERVSEDVKINTNLWLNILNKYRKLYNNDEEVIKSHIKFLMVKAKTYKMFLDNPLKINLIQANKNLEILEGLINEKVEALRSVMPKVPKKVKRSKPKNIYKKDGTLSKAGERWNIITKGVGLDLEYEGEIEEIVDWLEPNPQSVHQVKDWLFSLGWKPEIFNDSTSVTGEVSKVPQVRDKNKDLCKSVLKLAEKEPAIKELDDLSVIQHRAGIIKGFIRDSDEEGNIVAGVGGLANCVTADTVIITNRGALPICEITTDDQVLTHKGVWRRVTDFINNGIKPIYRITTSKGKSIKCTGEHRFYKGNEEWVPAKSIKCGEEIYGYGDKEVWKPVGSKKNPNFISSWGRYTNRKGVPSYYRKRVHKDIREFCTYTDDSGKKFDVQRSRLIMEKFKGPSSLHVLHKDGKSCNNNIQNLYYGTDKDNHQDAKVHGTLVKAHRNRVNSKLTISDVRDIRYRLKKGETGVSIAKHYDIHPSYVSQIKNGKRWSDKKNVDNRYIETFEKEKVVSVEKLTPEPTFDISVEEDHSYVANGLVTHNTLRIKHRTLVNLPSVSAPYGEYIRSLIIPQEGYKFIGSDISGLENQTKLNFIYPYDPEYVKEMMGKYYDSHLDIGQTAGLVTLNESIFYRWYKDFIKGREVSPEDIVYGKENLPNDYKEYFEGIEDKEKEFERIDLGRQTSKTLNYASVYSVGSQTLAELLGCSKSEASKLIDAYWKRNWSVQKFAEDQKEKTIDGETWILNPINNYWYNLRSQHTRFSVLNQSAGDYIFTLWCYFCMEAGLILQAGFHDEVLVQSKEEDIEKNKKILQESMNKVNKILGLSISIGIDYAVGDTYADVH